MGGPHPSAAQADPRELVTSLHRDSFVSTTGHPVISVAGREQGCRCAAAREGTEALLGQEARCEAVGVTATVFTLTVYLRWCGRGVMDYGGVAARPPQVFHGEYSCERVCTVLSKRLEESCRDGRITFR